MCPMSVLGYIVTQRLRSAESSEGGWFLAAPGETAVSSSFARSTRLDYMAQTPRVS